MLNQNLQIEDAIDIRSVKLNRDSQLQTKSDDPQDSGLRELYDFCPLGERELLVLALEREYRKRQLVYNYSFVFVEPSEGGRTFLKGASGFTLRQRENERTSPWQDYYLKMAGATIAGVDVEGSNSKDGFILHLDTSDIGSQEDGDYVKGTFSILAVRESSRTTVETLPYFPRDLRLTLLKNIGVDYEHLRIAELHRFQESANLPLQLQGWNERLFILAQKAAASQLEWWLIEVSTEDGGEIQRYRLPSHGSGLVLNPGNDQWAILEKQPVEFFGHHRVNIKADSMIVIPSEILSTENRLDGVKILDECFLSH